MSLMYLCLNQARVVRKRFGGVLLASLILSGVVSAKDYATDASKKTTGKDPISLIADRATDPASVYEYTPELCALCALNVANTFATDVVNQTNDINPAVDNLIGSLMLLDEILDMEIKDVMNLKLVNALYSFPYQTDRPTPVISTDTGIATCDDENGGCKPLDFSNPEDQAWYRENVIDRFETSTGGYDTSSSVSSAYGRYQFMADTGASYCQRAPASLNCCAGTWTYTFKREDGTYGEGTTTGAEWRTGANAQACQDAMFAEFTKDNVNSFTKNGIPQNSCTIYLAHQQGVGGLTWIMGGNMPSGTSYGTMKNRVKLNVGGKFWDDAIARGLNPDNEDDLRKIYQEYWSMKFCGDITENVGSTVPLGDLTHQAEQFSQLKTYRDTFFRRGILFELQRQKEEIKNIIRQLSTVSSD